MPVVDTKCPASFDGHRPRSSVCRRCCDIIAGMWTPLPDPRSSRWLGPELVAEVLARAGFGGSVDDAPRWTALSRGSRALTPLAFRLEVAFAVALRPLTLSVVDRAPSSGSIDRPAAHHRGRLATPPGLDTPDQDRARAARFRSDAKRDPERLLSSRKPAAFRRELQQLSRVIHTRRGASCTRSPGFLRDAASTTPRLPPGYAVLLPGPFDREPENGQRCIRPTSAIHISKTSTRTPCEDRIACRAEPRGHRWVVAFHALDPLRPAVSSPRRALSSRAGSARWPDL